METKEIFVYINNNKKYAEYLYDVFINKEYKIFLI